MFNSPQQGWQCPVCKTVYAPTVSECKCAANARARDGDTTWSIQWEHIPSMTSVPKAGNCDSSKVWIRGADGKYRLVYNDIKTGF